ncbi:MAG: DsbE family thiol:disulfide interchange protein [Rhodovulum sulfidophilum]|uniref:DsbE family thiol:disulfide interchange protein n=1 Tax=Rhodovulum sulfidophilum TaxID=35806 RepID=A0A2W5PZK8_RHOSU|nr:MAG: DsbE family thiol:disulfide interchange protein [Rhodovulum sulfidophilum]
MALPPLLFAAFAGVAYMGLRRENATELPSALIGREAPSLAGTVALRADPAPTDAELTAPGVKLVNFWASWCAPCRAEHPILKEISASGLPVIGVNYKDQPDKALGFLEELGDPFTHVGADPNGRVALDWGIYGVPETFVVDANGKILLRYPGPLTRAIFDAEIKPLLRP